MYFARVCLAVPLARIGHWHAVCNMFRRKGLRCSANNEQRHAGMRTALQCHLFWIRQYVMRAKIMKKGLLFSFALPLALASVGTAQDPGAAKSSVNPAKRAEVQADLHRTATRDFGASMETRPMTITEIA